MRDIRTAERVVARHWNLCAETTWLIRFGIGGKPLEYGMLDPGWRESHRNGFSVYRAAGRNYPTVAFKKRLEAEAHAEDGSGAQGGVCLLYTSDAADE